jgi:hypothetical protein
MKRKSAFHQIMMGAAMLFLVPWTIYYIILDAIFIVEEYQTKFVKKILSHNIWELPCCCWWHPSCCQFVLLVSVDGGRASPPPRWNPSHHFFTSTTWLTCLDCITRVGCGLWNGECHLQYKPQDFLESGDALANPTIPDAFNAAKVPLLPSAQPK